jgi:hypothetical protein
MEGSEFSPVTEENFLPTSPLAVVSLIAALLGFTFVPLVGGIVAVVTGYLARNETRSIPPRASGDGMATAGIVMGVIQIGLLVVGICCAVVAFVLMAGWSVTYPR